MLGPSRYWRRKPSWSKYMVFQGMPQYCCGEGISHSWRVYFVTFRGQRNTWQGILKGHQKEEQGPEFFRQPQSFWPKKPKHVTPLDTELQKPTVCGLSSADIKSSFPDVSQFQAFQELLEATTRGNSPLANDSRQAESLVPRQAQLESFPDDLVQFQAVEQSPTSSCLLALSPELDRDTKRIKIRRIWNSSPCFMCPPTWQIKTWSFPTLSWWGGRTQHVI